jgi:hypothetical protein
MSAAPYQGLVGPDYERSLDLRFATIGLLLSGLALTACQGENYSRAYTQAHSRPCVPRAYDAGLCNNYDGFGPSIPRGGTASAGF